MKKFFSVLLKGAIFFIGWAICVVFLPDIPTIPGIPIEGPAYWRLGAELVPFLAVVGFTIIFWLLEKPRLQLGLLRRFGRGVCVGTVSGVVWLGVVVGVLMSTKAMHIVGLGDLQNGDIVMIFTKVMDMIRNHSVSMLWVWIVAVLLNVTMQEMLFRGYLYQIIKAKYNGIAAAFVTTTLFAIMHIGALEAGLIPALNVITMSLLMTMLLEYTRSLWAPIMAHFVWNAVGGVVLGGVMLPADYPHLLQTTFSGSNILLSGGANQIEGSVIVLALNCVLCIFFGLLARKKIKGNR